jgi:hypothetical protein
MEIFYIKRNDTSPSIRYALSPTSVDLTGATVRFHMRARGGATVVYSAASVVTATGTPTVEYDWDAADTDTAGVYEAEFEVTYPVGAIETFPSVGYIRVSIEEDIEAI